MIFRIIFLLLLGVSSIYAVANREPWWTGSLLSASGKTSPVGAASVEPYILYANYFGVYNSGWLLKSRGTVHSINPLIYMSTGLSERIDINFLGQAFYNYKGHKSFVGVGDTAIGFGFGLLKETAYAPAIRLAIVEVFPTGNYHHLNPDLEALDAVGAGSFQTRIGLRMQKTFEFDNHKLLKYRFNINYTMPIPFHVENRSAYGGGLGTSGTIYPGAGLFILSAIEYQLSQHWVFSLDALYVHSNASSFKGVTFLPINISSAEQFSVAPAIEYNFNEKIGIIAGVWATIAGRNAAAFYSPAIAVNMSF